VRSFAITAALSSAVAFGIGSVLQKTAADRVEHSSGLDPRLLGRLLSQGRYVLGWVLDVAGYALQVLALSALPLFVVQSFVAMGVGFTAVFARFTLGAPLPRAVAAKLGLLVLAGVLLGISAPVDAPLAPSLGRVMTFAAALAAIVGMGAWIARRPSRGQEARYLGALAGCAFALVSILGKTIAPTPGMPLVPQLIAALGGLTPYLLVAAALSGALLFSAGLQRGPVVAVEAPAVAVDLMLPAFVGVVLLGEHLPHGWNLALAVGGFAAALIGAWGLAQDPAAPGLRGSVTVQR
jgi:hypothetical protein